MYYDKQATYPIPPVPSWNVQDASKLTTFMTCERMYFYEYVLGWRNAIPNNHPHFGTSWHEAMEYLLLNDYNDSSVVAEAYHKFLTKYREEFDEDSDAAFWPKTPNRALKALAEYTVRWKNDQKKFKLLELNGRPLTEIAGTVHITEDYMMHFRMDSVMEGINGIFSLDHKTASTSYGWEDKWSLELQPTLYNHVLYCMYPPEQVYGIVLRGTVFKKNKGTRGGTLFEFVEARVHKTLDQMQTWLWNITSWLDSVRWNFEMLSNCKESDSVMKAFPMRTIPCAYHYGRPCPYKSFCLMWPNPLQRCEQPPIGFEVRHWDPSQLESSNQVNL